MTDTSDKNKHESSADLPDSPPAKSNKPTANANESYSQSSSSDMDVDVDQSQRQGSTTPVQHDTQASSSAPASLPTGISTTSGITTFVATPETPKYATSNASALPNAYSFHCRPQHSSFVFESSLTSH
ncbi:hypothetical protein P7C70_g6808, partial [Phenoliferia sp. Uapishka_3]